MTAGYTVIVPVKSYPRAKTRLAVSRDRRAGLAEEFARHVLATAADAELVDVVVVVGDAADAVPHAVRLPDPGGLNEAVDAGRRWALEHRPTAPVAVLPADLPALTATTLDAALAAGRQETAAFWVDRHGHGTTLLTAATPGRLVAAYGVGSAMRHRELGLTAIPGAWPGVRDDVDTLADLERAGELGVGAAIAHLIAAWGLSPARLAHPA